MKAIFVKIFNKFLCGPHCFLAAHRLVHYSSSNTFFKIAKSLFEDHGEIVKFVHCPRDTFCLFIEIYWSVAEEPL